jgi:hypothetical protein
MSSPKLDYEGLFRDPRMFNSRSSFAAAGFEVKQPASHNIMVGSHPSVGQYLFKKYNHDVPLDEQEENYETRIEGAQKIRWVIDRYQLRHLVVPHKWLYELPRSFSKRKRSSYVLVADRIDLLSVDETTRRYRNIDPAVLDDLCRVLFHFRGFDAAIHNLRFTTSGQIAFIDTESWDRSSRRGTGVFRRINEELTKEMRKRVDRTFERLYDDE